MIKCKAKEEYINMNYKCVLDEHVDCHHCHIGLKVTVLLMLTVTIVTLAYMLLFG